MCYACGMAQSPVSLTEKFARLRSHLNEAGMRLWAASEALALGYGGVSEVSRVTGLSRTTIHAGMAELERPAATLPDGRERRSGGGRKPLVQKDPGLRDALNRLVDTKGGHSVSQRRYAICWPRRATVYRVFARRVRDHTIRIGTRSFIISTRKYRQRSGQDNR